MNSEHLSKEELLALDHNDHRAAFEDYRKGGRHSKDKQAFLRSWVQPQNSDTILECGSSSGKTSVDFTRHSDCTCIGIDFDPLAVEISRELRDQYFPELKDRCIFKEGDLETMDLDYKLTKILMPDFTEHIPDKTLGVILGNIKRQLPRIKLYIYTPDGSHMFERLKKRNILLKNSGGHVNVKTRKELTGFLEQNGWTVESALWRPSHFPGFNFIERLLGRIPLMGSLFHRRIAIIATPDKD